jgi:hypothetical protein
MGLNHREVREAVPVTREDVYQWVQGYKSRTKTYKDGTTLRDHIAKKFEEGGFDGDTLVDTTTNDSLGDNTKLLDMIYMDLESYDGASA